MFACACGGQSSRSEVTIDAGSEGGVDAGEDVTRGDAVAPSGYIVLSEDDQEGLEWAACWASDWGPAPAMLEACVFPLPPAPAGYSYTFADVTVAIRFTSGETWLILPTSETDCVEGWYPVGEGEVALCAETCALLRGDPSIDPVFMFSC